MSHDTQSIDDSTPKKRSAKSRDNLYFWLASSVLAGVLIIPQLVLPRGNFEPVRRTRCNNNLKQIGYALHKYHDEFGVFPPAYISDEDGRPMHSWRVLILPYVEQLELYEKYDFSEPWDGPKNIKLLKQRPNVYSCPSRYERDSTLTAYAAIVGDECVFRGPQPVSIAEITDGTSNTGMVSEVSHARIRWTEPRDISFGAFPGIGQPDGLRSDHDGGVFLMRADGSVKFLSEEEPTEKVRAMLTRNGGD